MEKQSRTWWSTNVLNIKKKEKREQLVLGLTSRRKESTFADVPIWASKTV